MENLTLHVPSYNDLWYREKLLNDPETMSYNRGYAPWDGYHADTGCIDFPKSEWREWYEYFIGHEPERWYAYVTLGNGTWIGEVNVHGNGIAGHYDMGIVLEAKYRGKGYAKEALSLLLAHAFDDLSAEAVHNNFEDTRTAAVRTHLACGFEVVGRENGIVMLTVTRERYINRQETV